MRANPMRSGLLPLVAVALALPVSAVPPQPTGSRPATRMVLAGAEIERVEVEADESNPPRFTLVVVREMPTPGWTWRVDAIEIDAANRRIAARLTEVAPAGMAAQVITATRFELPIGTVEVGDYFVELETRRGPDRDHRPAHAWVLEAR